MTYYVQLFQKVDRFFGAGVTGKSVVATLQQEGVSKPNDFGDLPLQTSRNKVVFDGKYALLLGTDKKSRQEIGVDLMQRFGDVDEIGLQLPKSKEWLACVTLVEPDSGTPTFQVIALVGSGALQTAKVNWTEENKPPQIWRTLAWYDKPTASKSIRDIKSFTGMGRW